MEVLFQVTLNKKALFEEGGITATLRVRGVLLKEGVIT